MKLFFAVLILFLLAFAGLAAGLLLRRRGLSGGCGSTIRTGRECQCKSDLKIKVLQVKKQTKTDRANS